MPLPITQWQGRVVASLRAQQPIASLRCTLSTHSLPSDKKALPLSRTSRTPLAFSFHFNSHHFILLQTLTSFPLQSFLCCSHGDGLRGVIQLGDAGGVGGVQEWDHGECRDRARARCAGGEEWWRVLPGGQGRGGGGGGPCRAAEVGAGAACGSGGRGIPHCARQCCLWRVWYVNCVLLRRVLCCVGLCGGLVRVLFVGVGCGGRLVSGMVAHVGAVCGIWSRDWEG